MSDFFNNKRVLVTGACGTVGSEIISLLSTSHQNADEIIGIDNNENSIFFYDDLHSDNPQISIILADIRDKDDLLPIMKGIDIVIHAAAFKHVMLSEVSPNQFIKTNIYGLQNIIQCAATCEVKKFIYTSSDKAVNPTNIMGVTKLLGEKLISSANEQHNSTIFASTRFGNVLGSAGSVFPIFLNQIKEGRSLTLTSKEMTRFVMSIKQAADLVINSAYLARGGEIFVTKMPVLNILDLAQVMINEFAPKFDRNPSGLYISEIGVKRGEKMFEELMNHEETRRTIELEKYYLILPPFLDGDSVKKYSGVVSSNVDIPYNSEDEEKLSLNKIKSLLEKYGLLE